VASFFFARTKKKELFFQKERKKNKQKTKKRRILDPVFDWGLALNPIAFIHSHAKFIIY